MKDSQRLLTEYVENGSEEAFRELIARYVDLVYSTAVRRVNGNTQLAEEVAQDVFTHLACTARTLSGDVMLGGWLHRHTCFLAANSMRSERRRHLRENQAVQMSSLHDNPEENITVIAPILDEAIDKLGEADRTAVLLRFFEQKDFRSIGEALGSNEDAARMRVSRALEKLQGILQRRGITTTAVALSGTLAAHAIQTAPAGLTASISVAAAASAKAACTQTVLTATKTIAMTTLQKSVITATMAALVAATLYESSQISSLHQQVRSAARQQGSFDEQMRQLQRERNEATNQIALLLAKMANSKGESNELLRLRGEVARLRAAQAQSTLIATDPLEAKMKTWARKVEQLKRHLADHPEARIPEMQYLGDFDWIAYAGDEEFRTEADLRKASSGLRNRAENYFAQRLQPALEKFAAANKGTFPSDLSELQSYFEAPVEDAILQRWQIVRVDSMPNSPVSGDWVVTQKTPIDEEFDQRWGIGASGYGPISDGWHPDMSLAADIKTLKPVMQAYAAVNDGKEPSNPSDLLPYLTTSKQQAAYRRLLERKNSASK